MDLPFDLQNNIVEFLKSIPDIYKTSKRYALLYSAGLDKELHEQIDVNEPPALFCQLLVPKLLTYGKLKDGRDSLEALLNAAKKNVGKEGQDQCDKLIQELQNFVEEHKDEVTLHPSDEKKQDKQPTSSNTKNSETAIFPPSLEELIQKNPDCVLQIQRTALMDEIKGYFAQTSEPKHVVLYGQPMVGKTTILKSLETVLCDEYVPVHINLQRFSSLENLDDFLFFLANKSTNKFRSWAENKGITISATNPERDDFKGGNGRFAFYKQWENLTRATIPKLPIVMFDEIETLLGERKSTQAPQFIEFLSNFVSDPENGLFILSGSGRAQYPDNSTMSELLRKNGKLFKVKYYHEKTTFSIFCLLQEYLTYEDSVLHYLMALCDGHPCFFSRLYDAVSFLLKETPGKQQLREDDIDLILNHIIERAHYQLWDLTTSLTTDEQAVTWLISRDLDNQITEVEYSFNTLLQLAEQHDLKRQVNIYNGIRGLKEREWIELQEQERKFRLRLCIVPLWLRRKPIMFNRDTLRFVRWK